MKTHVTEKSVNLNKLNEKIAVCHFKVLIKLSGKSFHKYLLHVAISMQTFFAYF